MNILDHDDLCPLNLLGRLPRLEIAILGQGKNGTKNVKRDARQVLLGSGFILFGHLDRGGVKMNQVLVYSHVKDLILVRNKFVVHDIVDDWTFKSNVILVPPGLFKRAIGMPLPREEKEDL